MPLSLELVSTSYQHTKQIQVRPDEHVAAFAFSGHRVPLQGLLFGARFSAFWCQRTGAFLLRPLRGILSSSPHKAWLFVDDLLAALFRPCAHNQFALIIARGLSIPLWN